MIIKSNASNVYIINGTWYLSFIPPPPSFHRSSYHRFSLYFSRFLGWLFGTDVIFIWRADSELTPYETTFVWISLDFEAYFPHFNTIKLRKNSPLFLFTIYFINRFRNFVKTIKNFKKLNILQLFLWFRVCICGFLNFRLIKQYVGDLLCSSIH